MKLIPALLLTLVTGATAHGQSLKKYDIGNSGASAYFMCDPGKIEVAKSPDSSDVYTAECANGDLHYGTICVRLRDKISDLEKSESVLIAYMDYVKTSVNITKATGYGKGRRLKDSERTRGVVDYWEDKDKASWKVAGWTDGKYIVCMYVYTAKQLDENKANVFLNGLRLPGI